MTTVVLTNPGAARARRHLPALEQALKGTPSLALHLCEAPGRLAELVAHDRWCANDLLVINGGDGTVQHALSALLETCPTPRLPRFACLPGGTTNMTAYDVNRHRDWRRCLATLARAGTEPPTVRDAPRPVVRVSAPAAGNRCGMFFGMGTIVQGIEYFHHRVRPSGGGHELGAGVALGRTLWGIARRQPPFAEPLAVRVNAPGLLVADHPLELRLLLVTALDRLFLGLRPYWGESAGPLKATVVEAGAGRLLASMPRLLRGRPSAAMTPERGYHSGGFEEMRLRFTGSYTLDGELFPHRGDTMTISATDPVRFLPL